MTVSDLVSTLLVAGFYTGEHEIQHGTNNLAPVNLNGEEATFAVDLSYKGLWRYQGVRPFDIGMLVLEDERLLVLHESDPPNKDAWEHWFIFNSADEAWGFIRNFLQEHP